MGYIKQDRHAENSDVLKYQKLSEDCLAMACMGYGAEASLKVKAAFDKSDANTEKQASPGLAHGVKMKFFMEARLKRSKDLYPLAPLSTMEGLASHFYVKNFLTQSTTNLHAEQLKFDHDTVQTGVSSAERILLAKSGIAYLQGAPGWQLLDKHDKNLPKEHTMAYKRKKQFEDIIAYEKKKYAHR